MIEIKKTKTLVCDGCGTRAENQEIRSYNFQHTEYDGHRNNWLTSSVELCRQCQRVVYPKLKEIVAATRGEQ